MQRLLLLVALAFVLGSTAHAQTVFINEIHYDNTGGDTAEGVEVAGPASTDLSTYELEFINGSNGDVYNTQALSGTIPDQDNGFGTLNFAVSGIQNGGPDGIALINNGTLVQCLSYEGSFTVSDASSDADGATCSDIGVSEPSSTPVGESLQLQGTGSTYTDFTWAGPITATAGAVNTGQSFGGGGGITVQFAMAGATVNEGDGTYDLDVTISSAPASTTTVDVVLDGGSSTGDAADIDSYTTQTVTFTTAGSTTQTVTLTLTDDGDVEGTETIQFDLASLSGDPAASLGTPSSFDLTINDNDVVVATGIIINEFDADTADEGGEFVELFDGGSGNTLLDGLVLVFYNGSDDQSYSAFDLDGQSTDANGFFVLGDSDVPGVDLIFSGSTTASQIQNGADAIALFEGDAAAFPNDTPITTTGLRDVVIYGTGDARDLDLLTGFGETVQFEEDYRVDGETTSLQRINIGPAPLAGGGTLYSSMFYPEPATSGASNSATRTVDHTSDVWGNSGNASDNEAQGWRSYSVPVLFPAGPAYPTSLLQSINLVQGLAAAGLFTAEFPDIGANILPVFNGSGFGAGDAATPNPPGSGGFWYWYDRDIDSDPGEYGGGTEGNDSYDLANASFSFSLNGVPPDDLLNGGTPWTVTEDGLTTFAGTAVSTIYFIGNPGAYPYYLGGISADGGTLSDVYRVWDPQTQDFTTLMADYTTPTDGDRVPVWNGAFVEDVTGTTSSATFSFPSDYFDPTENDGFVGREVPESRLAFHLDGEVVTESGRVAVTDADVLVRFLDTATRDFDRHDATKILPPTQEYALLAPVGDRGDGPYYQDVYSLPTGLETDAVVPFAIRTSTSGTFRLGWDAAILPAEWSLSLRDLVTGEEVDLRAGEAYAFESDATDWATRFELVISPQSVVSNEPDAASAFRLGAPTPNPATEEARLGLTVGMAQTVHAAVYDALGREVAVLHDGPVAAGTPLVLRVQTADLAPGVYVVRAQGEQDAVVRRLTVTR